MSDRTESHLRLWRYRKTASMTLGAANRVHRRQTGERLCLQRFGHGKQHNTIVCVCGACRRAKELAALARLQASFGGSASSGIVGLAPTESVAASSQFDDARTADVKQKQATGMVAIT
jgi:hypothetical protein